MKVSNTQKLVESAVLIAIATVLSLYKLIDLPYGGSVTIASMLPLIIISYRYGLGWGLVTGLAYGIIQQLLGLHTLSYVSTWQSILAVIMLDYVVAFAATGFGGVFRGSARQPLALMLGSLLVCVLRYICHVISGATVWAGLSIPTNAALVYSLGYNATYMVPETIVTMVIAYYIGSILNFGGEEISRFRPTVGQTSLSLLSWLGGLSLVGGIVFDAKMVFSCLQDAESGEFMITGLADVNWASVIAVSAAAIVIAVILFAAAKKKKNV